MTVAFLLVAKALVNAQGSNVPITVLNLTDEPITIQRDTTLALVNPVISFNEETISMPSNECTENLPDHLQIMVDKAQLDDIQKAQLAALLLEFPEVFIGPEGELGHTDLVKHRINTGDAPPTKSAPYRHSLSERLIEDEEIDKMLANNVIEPSSSPWASPVVLVKKKDGTTRFCLDYRKLNSVTQKDAYPLPRIEDTIDALSGSKWFCTMDLASWYWQIAMADEDKEKTAFVTRRGLSQWECIFC